jgi:hypothetical protein
MKRVVWVLIFVSLLLVNDARADDWTTREDSHFGYSYSYPQELFAEVEGERPAFHYFQSPNTGAKFLAGAWDNEKGETPGDFKQWMLTHADGYEDVTYEPRGRSWFVVSGYRGDQIYYEKVIFSCGGRIVNILAAAYPEARRELFDPIVERMEDHFKGGRRCD